MAFQMMITLSDEEYATLSAEATRTGKPLEALLHESLRPRLQPVKQRKQQVSEEEFTTYLYQQGVIADTPTNELDLSGEEMELERLAQLFSGGKMASEMVIEDRGPY